MNTITTTASAMKPRPAVMPSTKVLVAASVVPAPLALAENPVTVAPVVGLIEA